MSLKDHCARASRIMSGPLWMSNLGSGLTLLVGAYVLLGPLELWTAVDPVNHGEVVLLRWMVVSIMVFAPLCIICLVFAVLFIKHKQVS